MVEAATLPLVGITAWNALLDRAEVASGQKVLVHASCGGVGHIGLQLAKAFGAEVHATASDDRKIGLGFELGADRMINYKQTDVDSYVRSETDGKGYDAVFDTVGGKCLDDSFQATRIGGTVVSIAARSTHDLTPVHAQEPEPARGLHAPSHSEGRRPGKARGNSRGIDRLGGGRKSQTARP